MNIPAWFCKLFTPEWLTALGTVGTVIMALVLALWGEEISRLFVHPRLSLKARVRRPDSEKIRRQVQAANAGTAYFFRLAIWNSGNAAAHDVQVFLADIERVTAQSVEKVSRFTPMYLKWAYQGSSTLPTLLPDMPPIYCDMAHVTDPSKKVFVGEHLSHVAPQDAVLALDVEFPSNMQGHLLEAGTYYFHLILAAENSRPRRYRLEVIFLGQWFEDEDKMFDVGFKMRAV